MARHGIWVGKVRHGGRLHHAGSFESIEAAETAVIDLRNRLFTNNLTDQVPASTLSNTTR